MVESEKIKSRMMEEEPLLMVEQLGDGGFTGEVKRLSQIAWPMVVVILSQYMVQVVSVMMVGHLGELSLSSTAIAMSLAGVTGFSFIIGMASGLETLSGQAFGAKQYRKMGTQLHAAILCLTLVCIPVSILWMLMDRILMVVGQDPLIAKESGKLIKWLIPALFSYATLQPVVRYLQTQSLTTPMLGSSVISLLLHLPLCWLLVFKSGLGNVGAALSIGISYWFNALFLLLYINISPSCDHTRVPVSMQMFPMVPDFFRIAVPSAVMICLEWWSFELLILLSGLLPNPQLEASILSVCLSTISTLYSIPYGFGAAGSTRIANELGAGNAMAAKRAVYALMFLAVVETSIVSTTLFMTRKVFGYTFSNEEEVVNYVTKMAPLICISVILDSIQGVLSGVARGCGWQHIGAYVNLAAFYLCGIPVAAFLAFSAHLRGLGLWIGIQTGALLQTILLSIVTCFINWDKQATLARDRIFSQDHPNTTTSTSSTTTTTLLV